MPETLTKIDSDPVSVDTVDGQELMVTIMNLYLTMSVSTSSSGKKEPRSLLSVVYDR